jgi:hypothetical protein
MIGYLMTMLIKNKYNVSGTNNIKKIFFFNLNYYFLSFIFTYLLATLC